jgi:hypothetical protein
MAKARAVTTTIAGGRGASAMVGMVDDRMEWMGEVRSKREG